MDKIKIQRYTKVIGIILAVIIFLISLGFGFKSEVEKLENKSYQQGIVDGKYLLDQAITEQFCQFGGISWRIPINETTGECDIKSTTSVERLLIPYLQK